MTVVITTVVAVLAGYAFARFRFRGKGVLFGISIGMLLVPYPALLVSLFTVMIWLGLTNSLFGLALIYSTFQMPFAIYMMRNSFESVPEELVEAAELDGCSKVTALPRVMLPLVAPGVVTVALFAFLAAWNEFIAALVLLNDNAELHPADRAGERAERPAQHHRLGCAAGRHHRHDAALRHPLHPPPALLRLRPRRRHQESDMTDTITRAARLPDRPRRHPPP